MLYIYTRKKKKDKERTGFLLGGERDRSTIENDTEKAETLQPFFTLLKRSRSIQTVHRLQNVRT